MCHSYQTSYRYSQRYYINMVVEIPSCEKWQWEQFGQSYFGNIKKINKKWNHRISCIWCASNKSLRYTEWIWWFCHFFSKIQLIHIFSCNFTGYNPTTVTYNRQNNSKKYQSVKIWTLIISLTTITINTTTQPTNGPTNTL